MYIYYMCVYVYAKVQILTPLLDFKCSRETKPMI